MKKQIVILGGGTGGTMVANRLRRRFDADEAEIHVVDRDDRHVYQPGLLYVPFGLADVDEIVRPRRRQLRRGVDLSRGRGPVRLRSTPTRSSSTTARHSPTTSSSSPPERASSRRKPRGSPGLAGTSASSPSTRRKASAALREALDRFEGGRLVVNLVDMPIKCPIAPLEFAFLADWYLRERGIRARTELVYATPLDGAFTKALASEQLGSLLAEKGIELVTEFNAGEVDGIDGKLTSYDGRELDFDLLVSVPLHGGARLRRVLTRPRRRARVRADRQAHAADGRGAERLRTRRRDRPADVEGRLGDAFRGRGARREHRPLLPRRGARAQRTTATRTASSRPASTRRC